MKKIEKSDINILRRLNSCNRRLDETANGRLTDSDDRNRNMKLLMKASGYRSALYPFLQKVRRNRNIYIGKQWEDIIMIGNKPYKARDIYKQMGKNPMNINVVQSTVRNIIGQYRKGEYKPIIISQNREGQKESEMMTVALQSVLNENNIQDRNARQLENFILSGFPIYKTTYAYDHLLQKSKVLIRSVSPQSIIINSEARDLFGKDINFIAEIRDYSYEDMMSEYSEFVGGEKIKNLCFYRDRYEGAISYHNTFTTEEIDSLDVLFSNTDVNKSRVIEIWQLEGAERIEYHDPANAEWAVVKSSELEDILRENEDRKRMSAEQGIDIPLIRFWKKYYKYWKTYHISAVDYSTLYESETPYVHLDHPYTFYCYPGIDGSVGGLAESLNDIQMLVSRNIMLQDMLIATSTKNLLLVPKSTFNASNVPLKEVSNQFNKIGGVLVMDYNNADKPAPLMLNATPGAEIGINNIIQSTLHMLREVSGVKDSMLGETPLSGEPYASYRLSAANANLNIVDLIEGFNTFINKTYEKAIKLIKQYWQDKHYINVAGIDTGEFAKNYDPQAIRDFEFTSVIAQGDNNSVMRDMVTKELLNLMSNGLISFEMFLQHGNMPYSDRILQQIKKFREEMEAGEMPKGVPQWLAAEYQNIQQQNMSASPEAQAMLDEYVRNGSGIQQYEEDMPPQ
ncbi:MAG: hypothetical protein LBP85_08500 [Prevotellaceae bacterium]|jgi:hypothetical protein|nr:hypothetical protein [Prevotellaceae bacterium]